MPIYEFACDHCRKVFQFLFKSPTVKRRPKCPKCGRGGLKKHLSRFAVGGAERKSAGGDGGDVGPDDARMEAALGKLEREMAGLDENDPKQMGKFMRRVMEETGTDLDPEMESAIRRLEAGEDPEKIEEEMGDILGGEGGPGSEGGYDYDDGLYDA